MNLSRGSCADFYFILLARAEFPRSHPLARGFRLTSEPKDASARPTRHAVSCQSKVWKRLYKAVGNATDSILPSASSLQAIHYLCLDPKRGSISTSYDYPSLHS